jgi:6-pyruvoyltetrahydropterin/6-carboxytetrahydropterin synthase
MEEFTITREIGIDMGHRVTYHGSKCRNLHGHRYTIQATCKGPLYVSGEQEGMVLDFGFLKEEMMREIDAPCDHGTTLWLQDSLATLFTEGADIRDWADICGLVAEEGYFLDNKGIVSNVGKLYLVPFVPTAENLAKHWFERLAPRVQVRSQGQARLLGIDVYETPNCKASYYV